MSVATDARLTASNRSMDSAPTVTSTAALAGSKRRARRA
jgi:hypothetical protein